MFCGRRTRCEQRCTLPRTLSSPALLGGPAFLGGTPPGKAASRQHGLAPCLLTLRGSGLSLHLACDKKREQNKARRRPHQPGGPSEKGGSPPSGRRHPPGRGEQTARAPGPANQKCTQPPRQPLRFTVWGFGCGVQSRSFASQTCRKMRVRFSEHLRN